MGIKKANIFRIWCKQTCNDGTETYFQSKICFKTKPEADKYAKHLNSTNPHSNELSFFCREEQLCLASKASDIISSNEDSLKLM